MLRTVRKDSRVDLIEAFRDLAPSRERISIQRWSRRRIAMTVVTVIGFLIFFTFIWDNLTGRGFI
jgi:hypothetical protein